MTALDDALNSAAPVFAPPTLNVSWRERPSDENLKLGENLFDLSDVLQGDFEVTQSFDDALPDPVTMTGSSDASGTLTATLLGRPEVKIGSTPQMFMEFYYNAGTTDYGYTGLNAAALAGDYSVVAMICPSPTVTAVEEHDGDVSVQWTALARVSSTTHTLFVYGREVYEGLSHQGPLLHLSESLTDSTWTSMTFRGTDVAGNRVSWRPKSVVSAADSGSGTAHASAAVTGDKGFAIGFWGGAQTLTWTNTGAGTEQGELAFTTCSLMAAQTSYFDDPGSSFVMSATSSAATANSVRVALVLEPYERPVMTPTQFWSPFNPNSPVYGFDRDTADVALFFNTLSDNGIEPTALFTGLMNDIQLKSGTGVELTGVSKARISLNKSLNLPAVFGRREGLTTDWLIAWILSKADRFFGPAPGPYTRYWAPMYGSVHGAIDSGMGYNYARYWDATVSNQGVRYPSVVTGPFHTAMFACSTAATTIETVQNPIDLYKQTKDVLAPWITEDTIANYNILQDQFTWSGAAGRVSFWVKGDANVSTGPGGNTPIFQYLLESRRSNAYVNGRVWVYLDVNRHLNVQMGNGTNGYGTIVWGSSLDLPTDGNWHFYSVSWSYWDGTVYVMRDGIIGNTNYYMTNGNIGYNGWEYNTDADLHASGGQIYNLFLCHMPLSDVILESALEVYQDNTFSQVWPAYPWPSQTATTRPANGPLEVVQNDTPVNGWDTLAELARNTISTYRCNELDEVEVFAPTYWGEAAQLVSSTVVDTEVNAQDLDVTYDPSQSRNVVTINFVETSVDQNYSMALNLQTATAITPGTSTMTFTLDYAVGELHGAATPHAAVWTLTNLTAFDVSSGNRIGSQHFMSVNSLADGSGVVQSALSVTGTILSFTQTTVTIQFLNKTGATQWLANNYQADNEDALPFLQILGYVVRTTDGYVTERDPGSISIRRERALSADMDWVHTRLAATQLAGHLVTFLARPRAKVQVVVQGDPRRVPGQVVTLADSQDTQAAGLWRIMSVVHSGDGPQYTQTLQLVAIGTVGNWDSGLWDQNTWGE